MILLNWIARAWGRLVTPPPPSLRLPGPRVLPSYARMGRYVAGGVVLDRRLRLLVQQRAAELAGCRWCIEQGRHLWRQAFLSPQELAALPRYGDNPLFSDRERAALAFTDALSRYADAAGGIPAPVLAELRRHYSEPEVAALTLAASEQHFFDPATGALGADAGLGGGARSSRRVAGSAVRNLW
ncbi:MAG TPA: carboxymuconolactone decarboxylase family protein [Gemmatimonadales bacterium]|nr:carboxymuconolactone decarboxylase family protein [Gemmatimonadales bacterium]